MKQTYNSLFLLFLLGAVLFLSYVLFKNYIFVAVIAATLAIATSDIYDFLRKKVKSAFLSSFILLFVMFGIIFLPITYFFFKAAGFLAGLDINALQSHIKTVMSIAESALSEIPGFEEKALEIFSKIDSAAIGKRMLIFLGSFTSGGAFFVIDASFIAMIYFILNIYGKNIVDFFLRASPLAKDEAKELIKESTVVIKSVFFSLFITAFLQGFLFGVFVYFYGLDALFLGMLYGFASMIPVVGGALVWIPTAIYMFFSVSPIGAIILAIYSIVVLATVADNFLRPLVVNWLNKKVLKTEDGLNEILVFFAMIAGVGQFGFFGIILGPAIMAMLISVIKVFQKLQEHREAQNRR